MGYWSRYPRRRLLCPSADDQPDRFVTWVQQEVRSGRYAVTIPFGEQTTWVMAQGKARLSPYTRIPLPDLSTFMLCRDKSETMKTAERLGIPIPRTEYPAEVGIEAVARSDLSYPVVLKPCISNGARGIGYPTSPSDLRALYGTTTAQYGPCIVQEYIPHSGMQYKAEVLMDARQKVLAAGVYDKPRFYPPTGGSSTLNSTVDRPDIVDVAVRFLKGIGWQGMGDCDFIVDPRDNVPKLMEVNPRFTRSIKILVCAGLEFPYLLYRMALGLPVEPQREYVKGLYLRYLLSDCVWFLRSPERFRARPSFFWFFGRNLREEIFSWADPGPFCAFCLTRLIDCFDRRRRRAMLR